MSYDIQKTGTLRRFTLNNGIIDVLLSISGSFRYRTEDREARAGKNHMACLEVLHLVITDVTDLRISL